MGRKKKRLRLALRQQRAAATDTAAVVESVSDVAEEKAPVEEPPKSTVASKISKIAKKRKPGMTPSTKKK